MQSIPSSFHSIMSFTKPFVIVDQMDFIKQIGVGEIWK
jgi:hypothetical protein